MTDNQQVIYEAEPWEALNRAVEAIATDAPRFVIADGNTARVAVPRIVASVPALADARVITIAAGDEHKTVDALATVWSALSDGGATRRSVAVNVGGGMVTDLGGFAASTFKRGIPFVNVPTTLLGAVDAAVGGKTGVNLGNLKNEVGVFNEARSVVISPVWFDTLPAAELLSGYGEILKHGLLTGRAEFERLLSVDPAEADAPTMLAMLRDSVEVKRAVVAADPTEQGVRRHLNLGHTAGHALETLAMEKGLPVPHGFAVAWGLLTAMVLSHNLLGMSSRLISLYAPYLRRNYGAPAITCDDYPRLIALMGHDKKNEVAGRISFTLLRDAGQASAGHVADAGDIKTALDITRDLLGI